MSDKAEKKKEEKPAEGGHGEPAKKGGIVGLLTKLPVLLGGAMAIEAAVMLVAFKMMAGGPATADASVKLDAAADHAEDKKDDHGESKDDPAKADDAHAAPAKDDGHGAAKKDDHAKPDDGHGKADGHVAAADAHADPKKQVEVMVVEFRAPNKIGGRTFLYDVSIYAVVRAKNKTKVETAFRDRGALIKDRVRTIIAQSDPDKLGGGAEPGLETLRRQVRFQLEQVVGEGLVDEILVPRCIPFRTDF